MPIKEYLLNDTPESVKLACNIWLCDLKNDIYKIVERGGTSCGNMSLFAGLTYETCCPIIMIYGQEHRMRGIDILESFAKFEEAMLGEIITGRTLDELINPNKLNPEYYSALYYGIDSEWIRNRARIALDSLGTRYNGAFNVDTKAKEYLELFLRKGNAKSYLNEKKAQAVDSLNSRYWVGDSYASLAKTISNAIIELPDINEQTLDTCLNWVGQIKDSYSEQLEDVSFSQEKTITGNTLSKRHCVFFIQQ